jgi:hypothetical protein
MNTSTFKKATSASIFSLCCVLIVLATRFALSQPAVRVETDGQPKSGAWFNTLVAHWTDYTDADYLSFIGQARPEIAQVGFYGVTFYSLAHTPFGKGYPAHLPVQGTQECGDWFANLNREIHNRGSKVVGHFNVSFIFGDPELKTGFFEWYDKGWDEKTLGAKPVLDPTKMLQIDADGKLIKTESYKIGGWPEYHGCLNNPAWRTVLKVMAKAAIDRGVDGLIANYFYRRDCMCQYCQSGFRDYLATHYSAAELREKMGIENLATNKFTAIPSWHDPKETTPYKMAALTWTQTALKEDFDDVFINYGRALKPNLLVAQWNHLGNFSQINGDERSALPGILWGRGEDYLWYSTGNAHSQTDLAKGDLGDGTLQLRYIRGAFGPKPYLLGKYEQTRIRASIAEGVANGGAGMGFYAPHKNAIGRDDFVRYFGFLRRHREYYQGAQPAGELLLLYPRSAVHTGDITPVETFRVLGKQLLRDGYAFDVLPDDLLTPERLSSYSAVIYCNESKLSDAAQAALLAFKGARRFVDKIGTNFSLADWQNGLSKVSQRAGSPTVLLSLMGQPQQRRLLVHLVNYNREEPPAGVSVMGRGPQDEKPIAVNNVQVNLALPPRAKIKSVTLFSPDAEAPGRELHAKTKNGRATFTVPTVLVYSVAVVQFK